MKYTVQYEVKATMYIDVDVDSRGEAELAADYALSQYKDINIENQKLIKITDDKGNNVTNHSPKSIDVFNAYDIDLSDKLENMLHSEISEDIYNECIKDENYGAIETTVMELLRTDSRFDKADYFEDLYNPDEHNDERSESIWASRLYNCDLIYMIAIARVLGLQEPKSASDRWMFGLS